MVSQAEWLAKEVKTTEVSVALPNEFMRCCAQMGELAKQAMDQQTVSSCKRDDPTVRFLPYVQLLIDWRAVSANPAKRSWRQTARMDSIEAMARNTFDIS